MREQALAYVLRALDYGIGPKYDQSLAGDVRTKAARILGKLEPLYREERVLRRLMREDEAEEVREEAHSAVPRLLAAPVAPAARA